MSIIPASEAKKISSDSQNGSISQLKDALLQQLKKRAEIGETSANEYIPKGITPYDIHVLSEEFQQAGYEVKTTKIGDQTIFSIFWN